MKVRLRMSYVRRCQWLGVFGTSDQRGNKYQTKIMSQLWLETSQKCLAYLPRVALEPRDKSTKTWLWALWASFILTSALPRVHLYILKDIFVGWLPRIPLTGAAICVCQGGFTKIAAVWWREGPFFLLDRRVDERFCCWRLVCRCNLSSKGASVFNQGVKKQQQERSSIKLRYSLYFLAHSSALLFPFCQSSPASPSTSPWSSESIFWFYSLTIAVFF